MSELTGPTRPKPVGIKGRAPSTPVGDYHSDDDVDSSDEAHHHTLGKGPNQAAPGNHEHDGTGDGTAYAPLVHSHPAVYDSGPVGVGWTNGWVDAHGARIQRYGSVVMMSGYIQATINDWAVFCYVPGGFRPQFNNGWIVFNQALQPVPVNYDRGANYLYCPNGSGGVGSAIWIGGLSWMVYD